MARNLFVLIVWLLILCTAYSRATATEADAARDMYRRYCASCHGADGKGKGAVSSQLKMKVPDLTTIKKRHNGVFPLDDVMATIDGRRMPEVTAPVRCRYGARYFQRRLIRRNTPSSQPY